MTEPIIPKLKKDVKFETKQNEVKNENNTPMNFKSKNIDNNNIDDRNSEIESINYDAMDNDVSSNKFRIIQ